MRRAGYLITSQRVSPEYGTRLTIEDKRVQYCARRRYDSTYGKSNEYCCRCSAFISVTVLFYHRNLFSALSNTNSIAGACYFRLLSLSSYVYIYIYIAIANNVQINLIDSRALARPSSRKLTSGDKSLGVNVVPEDRCNRLSPVSTCRDRPGSYTSFA